MFIINKYHKIMKYNKGFAPILIALIFTGVLVIGGGIYYLEKSSNDKEVKFEEKNIPAQNTEKNIEENSNVLPNSFLMQMYGEYDSSGADRNYQGELTFKNDEVINGSQIYTVGEGGSCKENCNRNTECIIKDKQWIDKNTNEKCGIVDAYSAPLTREGIITKINQGKFIQTEDLSKCKHAVTCYKITNASFIMQKEKQNNNTLPKNVVDPVTGAEFTSNGVIVSFIEGTSLATTNAIIASVGGTINKKYKIIPNAYYILIPDTGDTAGVYNAIDRLMQNREVEYAEPNFVSHLDTPVIAP